MTSSSAQMPGTQSRLRRILPALLAARTDQRDHRSARRRDDGPVKWCKTCSRYHPARAICDLYLRTRLTRGKRIGAKGRPRPIRTVKRWAH